MKFSRSIVRQVIYVLLILIFTLCNMSKVWGQNTSYQLQINDRLKINFWDKPELNTEVTIDENGEIELQVIGKLAVAGKTVNQFKKEVISQMALYNTVISQLGVVVEFGSKEVHVEGQVRLPGVYTFEEITNVWDMILKAGGPQPTAFLDKVAIVRKSENGKIYTANIAAALQSGKLNELPKVYPGDTIYLDGSSATGTTQSPLLKGSEVYVFGEVTRPGAVRFSEGTDMLEAIALAGGYTPTAKLNHVKHISVSTGTISVIEINLEKYVKNSVPVPIPVGPGDSIIIPRKSALGDQILINGLTAFVTASVTTLVVLGLR